MARYFGTDGIRGHAGEFLTPELAMRAACSYARLLAAAAKRTGAKRPRVVLGWDPRTSSPMLSGAIQAGLALGGCDVQSLGLAPTPVVPFVILKQRAAGGVMVTASHNPVHDNGIKFFGPDGIKLDDKLELQIEAGIAQSGPMTNGDALSFGQGSLFDPAQGYLAFLRGVAPAKPKRQLSIVLDCAHGATSLLAPLAFAAAGHQLTLIHATPDGRRINVKCGATDLAALGAAVRKHQADLGLAFDGDGDRVLAVDGAGRPVSGDVIIALFATRLKRYRDQAAVVMTHMTNIGVELALKARGVEMKRTEVGDTKVFASMRQLGLHLGGEQSGHIIMADKLPAGDGILAGLQLATLIAAAGQPLSELAADYPQFPQKLTNLKVRDKLAWQTDKLLKKQIQQIKAGYKDVRFYLRPSGTENVVRVLTETQDRERCEQSNRAVCEALTVWSGV